MKKIFAFAMALVSMAAAMTSCNNDNDMVTELDPATKIQAEEVKEAEVYVDFLLPVTSSQLDMMDITINYTIDGQTSTFAPADMTEVGFSNIMINAMEMNNPMCLSYRLPGTFTRKQMQEGTYEIVVNRNEEGIAKYENQKIDCFFGHGIIFTNASNGVSHPSINIIPAKNTDLSEDGVIDNIFKCSQEAPTHFLR